jgi:hypothetical protein
VSGCRLAVLLVCVVLTGCASYAGRGLFPGHSTASEVEALMGTPAERRAGPDGETVLWYPRLPYGRESYAARIAPDGRLVSVEQRLTLENLAKLERGKMRMDEVRDLLGPPYRADQFPRMQREIWTYQMPADPTPKILYVQFSPEGLLREVYYMDDPDFRTPRLGRWH